MPTESEHWEQLQSLFHLIADAPAAERERILADTCPDPELRRLALEIFTDGECPPEHNTLDLEDALNKSIDDTGSANVVPLLLTGDAGSRIGPYTLVRLLGSGGIGSVYLAERIVNGSPLQSALKVLAPHAAGPAFVERFLREQKILASLVHPNITRMLDAGLSETGQPYLVMEYVEGEHLDTWCDTRTLPIADRLRLFLRVCDAVAYAHRNLVVHLDLKPSNILVAGEVPQRATVKLLDFGTSKLLQLDAVQQAALTTATVMATPAYASPEQLRNEPSIPLTTASDVYSLGVILFEILTGRRPGGKASVAAMMERAISEREPERLTHSITPEAAQRRGGLSETRLRQLLRGDLATIVAKCLAPRAKDRYSGVDALAEDIRRALDGRPVLARPQTTLYLISKFLRRNQKAAIAAALFILASLILVGYAEWRQREAIREGQRAMRMQTFLYRLLYLANSNYTGKPTFTVPDFLQLGVKLLPDYIKDPADLRKAQMSLAESMYENSDLEGAMKVFNEVIANAKAAHDYDTEAEAEGTAGDAAYLLGQTELGLQLTTHALELARTQRVSPSVQIWSKVYYATNRERLGFRTDDNLNMLQSAAKEALRESTMPPHEVGDVFYSLGWDLKGRERFAEAETAYNQALQVYMKDAQAKCDQSAVYGELASVKDRSGAPQASLPLYQRAWDGLKACSGPDSRGALEQQDRFAGALLELNRAKEALPLIESSLPAWRKVAGASPDLAEPLAVLTRAYLATQQPVKAQASAEEFFSVLHGKVPADDRRLGESQLDWAQSLLAQNQPREALPHAEAAAKLLTNGKSPQATQLDQDARKSLATAQSQLKELAP
jgi:serine/threonine protein kinase